MKHKVRIEPLGVEIEVDHETSLEDIVADYGIEFPCAGNGTCGNCKIKLLEGEIPLDQRHKELLAKKGLSHEWRLACFSRVTGDVTFYINPCEYMIEADNRTFEFVPEPGYGIAVDLGSTTIVSQLVNLQTGGVEAVCTDVNPQSRFGADIISRITFAMQSDENRWQLCQLVRECIYRQLTSLLARMCEVRRVSIVGNTIMHHLFADLDVTPLAMSPFQSPHNEAKWFTPQDLDWTLLPAACVICFLPNISHFVGSDILAGIYAIDMQRQERYQILLDLGTNGEMVIGNRDRILCTSTAAGPAFEGINISQGMRASTGAIYKIEEAAEGSLHCSVVGNRAAVGICGSGLVDAIYWLLKRNKVDYSGALTEIEARFVPLTNKVGLTDKDIREFQLAKAAICTGMQLLLNELGISIKDVEHVYLAGGLGTYLHPEHAISIGLLEISEKGQLVKVGNSALTGAKRLLFQGADQEVETLLATIEHCSLESKQAFQDVYFEKIFFPCAE